MSNYKIIYNEKQINRIYNILPDLKEDEVYFISLSARKKYLNKRQREKFQLRRTEMFERKIIRYKNYNHFLKKLKRFEVPMDSYKTNNNYSIPPQTLICYININPSSIINALSNFQKDITDKTYEILKNGKNKNTLNYLKKSDVNILNFIQKSKSTRNFLDFDLDIPKNKRSLINHTKESIYNNILKKLKFRNYFIIDTKGGYHILIRKEKNIFNKEFNPKTIVDNMNEELNKIYDNNDYEFKRNNNDMIPLPGTLQGKYKVKIIDKF